MTSISELRDDSHDEEVALLDLMEQACEDAEAVRQLDAEWRRIDAERNRAMNAAADSRFALTEALKARGVDL